MPSVFNFVCTFDCNFKYGLIEEITILYTSTSQFFRTHY